MARLDAVPDPEVIRQFRGKVDFAVWRGVPYARAWPRPPSTRTQASLDAARLFQQLSREVSNTTGPMRDYVTAITQGTAWTWKDVTMRANYQNLEPDTVSDLAPQVHALTDIRWLDLGGGIIAMHVFCTQPTNWLIAFGNRALTTTPRYVVIRGSTVERGFVMDFGTRAPLAQWSGTPISNFAFSHSIGTWLLADRFGISINTTISPATFTNITNSWPPFHLADMGFPFP